VGAQGGDHRSGSLRCSGAGDTSLAAIGTVPLPRSSRYAILRHRLLHVQDAERKRLAQELHDGPLHTVLDLVRQADIAADLAHAAGAPVERHLRDLAERERDAAYELRAVCADLYPSELTHLGLVAALESLVQRINRDDNLTVKLRTETFPDDRRLPLALEEALYRTAREALDNVCRHAAATYARIDLGIQAGQVTLVVRDDGRGFHVPSRPAALARHGHLGLVGMRERIEGLGGAFAVTSAPGAGTTVAARVRLPGGEPDRPNRAHEVTS
jgi:two-component system sensor histidine kinase DegS